MSEKRKKLDIKDITDDEIVKGLMSLGIRGLNFEDTFEGNSFEWMTEKLTGIDFFEDEEADQEQIEGELSDRIRAMPDRIYDPDGNTFFVTPQEWARQLHGKSIEEMTKILKGGDEL